MGFKILVNSLSGGGAEIQAALLAKALRPDHFFILDEETSPRAGEAPVHEALVSGNCLPGALRTLMLDSYAARLAARTGPGDTVLSFMQRSNFVNVLAARKSGHRAVICEVTQPSGEYTGLRGLLMKPLIRRLYPKADMALANSKGNALDLEKNFGFPPGRVKVIYNSCDLTALRRKAAAPVGFGYEKIFRRPVIITCGRLTAAKGQWHLVKAFSEVKKSVPGAALVLLGDGELKAGLLQLCRRLGLSVHCAGGEAPRGHEDVILTGFRSNPYSYMARAKLFAFPSLWEGLPNAVIEALACGLPIISSDCESGPRELLAPATDFAVRTAVPEAVSTGFLMPPFPVKPEQEISQGLSPLEKLWAGHMTELLTYELRQKAMRTAALERAEDFSIKLHAAEWRKELGLPADC